MTYDLACELMDIGIDNESGGKDGPFVPVKPELRRRIVDALRQSSAEMAEAIKEVEKQTRLAEAADYNLIAAEEALRRSSAVKATNETPGDGSTPVTVTVPVVAEPQGRGNHDAFGAWPARFSQVLTHRQSPSRAVVLPTGCRASGRPFAPTPQGRPARNKREAELQAQAQQLPLLLPPPAAPPTAPAPIKTWIILYRHPGSEKLRRHSYKTRRDADLAVIRWRRKGCEILSRMTYVEKAA